MCTLIFYCFFFPLFFVRFNTSLIARGVFLICFVVWCGVVATHRRLGFILPTMVYFPFLKWTRWYFILQGMIQAETPNKEGVIFVDPLHLHFGFSLNVVGT